MNQTLRTKNKKNFFFWVAKQRFEGKNLIVSNNKEYIIIVVSNNKEYIIIVASNNKES